MRAGSYSCECGAQARRKKASHCAPCFGVVADDRSCQLKPLAATATALAVIILVRHWLVMSLISAVPSPMSAVQFADISVGPSHGPL